MVQPSTHVAHHRGRPNAAEWILTLGIALSTTLAFAAPLAHAHLDAAQAASHGLCGDHAPAQGVAAEPCQLCVAGGHAPAALPRDPGATPVPERSAEPAPPAPLRLADAPGHRPGDPRAPPFSA